MITNPTVSELRHEITSRLREIAACVGTADNSDLLEELEELQKGIIALDSLTRIPEESQVFATKWKQKITAYW